MKSIGKKFLLYHAPSLIRDYARLRKAIINEVPFGQYLKFRLSRKKTLYWPVDKTSEVTHPNNIFVGINTNIGTQPGCYIQGNGGIYIGNYTRLARNAAIMSGNHDVYDHTKHINKEVRIGDYCWLGQGCIILPGVELGPRTIVGAGAVVTKSFPEGYCIIGGNPAKKIKDLEKEKFIPTQSEFEFYGYIPKKKFKRFVKKHLSKNKYYEEIMTMLENDQ